MSGLQETYYIIGIIYMVIMLALVVALAIAVFVIRAKVIRIEHTIQERINTISTIAEKGGELAAAAVGGVARKTKRTLAKRR